MWAGKFGAGRGASLRKGGVLIEGKQSRQAGNKKKAWGTISLAVKTRYGACVLNSILNSYLKPKSIKVLGPREEKVVLEQDIVVGRVVELKVEFAYKSRNSDEQNCTGETGRK
jgi:hypothetical protein